jgi:hypothetical protein
LGFRGLGPCRAEPGDAPGVLAHEGTFIGVNTLVRHQELALVEALLAALGRGFRVSGFRVSGFRVLGFRVNAFGFRVRKLGLKA